MIHMEGENNEKQILARPNDKSSDRILQDSNINGSKLYHSEDLKIKNEFEKELYEKFLESMDKSSKSIKSRDLGDFLLTRLGYKSTAVELQELIADVDRNKEGRIDFEELKSIVGKIIKEDYNQTASIDAFEIFDSNKSGKMKKSEILSILKHDSENPMTQSEMEEVIRHLKFDENNEFNYKEFVHRLFDTFHS